MSTRSWITKLQVPGRGKIPKPDQPISQQHRAGRVATLAAEFCLLSYDASEAFPAMGTGGGGHRRRSITKQITPMPFAPGLAISRVSGWQQKLSRRAIFLISMDEEGGYKSLERFLPDYRQWSLLT